MEKKEKKKNKNKEQTKKIILFSRRTNLRWRRMRGWFNKYKYRIEETESSKCDACNQ